MTPEISGASSPRRFILPALILLATTAPSCGDSGPGDLDSAVADAPIQEVLLFPDYGPIEARPDEGQPLDAPAADLPDGASGADGAPGVDGGGDGTADMPPQADQLQPPDTFTPKECNSWSKFSCTPMFPAGCVATCQGSSKTYKVQCVGPSCTCKKGSTVVKNCPTLGLFCATCQIAFSCCGF